MVHLSFATIERFVLKELTEAEVQQVEKHVTKCPECEDRLQEQIDLEAAMRSSTAAMVRKIAKAEMKETRNGRHGRFSRGRVGCGVVMLVKQVVNR